MKKTAKNKSHPFPRDLIPSGKGRDKLARVADVYSFWGRFPLLYAAQDFITFMGRPGFVRGRAVRALELKEKRRVLEVACGTGRNLRYLRQAVGPRGSITGFDYTPEMLGAARTLAHKKGWRNIRFVQGDAAELKGVGGEYDGVISVLGISAIPQWEQAVARCREVLKPGGKLVVCDARLFSGFLKFLNPAVRRIYTRFAAWDPSKNIPQEMRKLFGNVVVHNLNAGTFYIAVSVKQP